jgi:hypothetical protein
MIQGDAYGQKTLSSLKNTVQAADFEIRGLPCAQEFKRIAHVIGRLCRGQLEYTSHELSNRVLLLICQYDTCMASSLSRVRCMEPIEVASSEAEKHSPLLRRMVQMYSICSLNHAIFKCGSDINSFGA